MECLARRFPDDDKWIRLQCWPKNPFGHSAFRHKALQCEVCCEDLEAKKGPSILLCDSEVCKMVHMSASCCHHIHVCG